MQDVEGKVAFITGGASGIGLGAAKAFVDAGMKVIMADVRQDNIDKALEYFQGKQQIRQVHAIKLDVTDRDAFARAAQESEAKFDKVHVLFNNAGMGVGGPIKDTRYDDWDWGLGVMVGGVINGITTFLPYLLKHGEGGHIVTTSSMTAIIPIPNFAIYCASKMAVIGLTESIRPELAGDNIGVSVFCPGPVQSNIQESAKTRPEHLKQNSGFAEREAELAKRPVSPLWMDNYECGQRILKGIRRNDLYILTHPEFEPGVRERFEAFASSFPHEPINVERAAGIKYLLGSPMMAEVIKHNKENPV